SQCSLCLEQSCFIAGAIRKPIRREKKAKLLNKLLQNKFSRRETHTTLAQGVRVWERWEVAMHFPLSQVQLLHCPILGNAELQNRFFQKKSDFAQIIIDSIDK
ncbi:MAG: hypothetical protein Q4F35_01820, partial [Akkermansia sp.]|nr:hypothetical protein [Akkermansia sp.]